MYNKKEKIFKKRTNIKNIKKIRVFVEFCRTIYVDIGGIYDIIFTLNRFDKRKIFIFLYIFILHLNITMQRKKVDYGENNVRTIYELVKANRRTWS